MGKYEEALERAKELHEAGDARTKLQMEVVFPVLKDDRIMLMIRNTLRDAVLSERVSETSYREMIAYLEEHFRDDTKMVEQKPIPKFKVGDCIYDKRDSYNRNVIREVGKDYYINAFAQKMDMAYTDANFEFLEHLDNDLSDSKPVHTAKEMWKEMRLEVYAQASGNRHEPNYSDDSTKMFSLCDIDEIFEKIGNSTVGSQPAEWSEEDEKMLTGIIERGSSQVPPYEPALREEQMEWLMNRLKSFRPQPKQEWSEEEMRKIVELKFFITQCNGFNKENRKKAFDMIDALRPRPHWKPSEEQMKALKLAYEDAFECPESGVPHLPLESLLSDLQKLL